MQFILGLWHIGEAKMDVLNIYLSLNIFVNISYHSRISSLHWFLLDVMILSNSILKPLAVIFIFQIVQVFVDNLSSTQLDIILISAHCADLGGQVTLTHYST